MPWQVPRSTPGAPYFLIQDVFPFKAVFAPEEDGWVLYADCNLRGSDSVAWKLGGLNSPPDEIAHAVLSCLIDVAGSAEGRFDASADVPFSYAAYGAARALGDTGRAGSAAALIGRHSLARVEVEPAITWFELALTLLESAGQLDSVPEVRAQLDHARALVRAAALAPEVIWAVRYAIERLGTIEALDDMSAHQGNGFTFPVTPVMNCRFYYDGGLNAFTSAFLIADGQEFGRVSFRFDFPFDISESSDATDAAAVAMKLAVATRSRATEVLLEALHKPNERRSGPVAAVASLYPDLDVAAGISHLLSDLEASAKNLLYLLLSEHQDHNLFDAILSDQSIAVLQSFRAANPSAELSAHLDNFFAVIGEPVQT